MKNRPVAIYGPSILTEQYFREGGGDRLSIGPYQQRGNQRQQGKGRIGQRHTREFHQYALSGNKDDCHSVTCTYRHFCLSCHG